MNNQISYARRFEFNTYKARLTGVVEDGDTVWVTCNALSLYEAYRQAEREARFWRATMLYIGRA